MNFLKTNASGIFTCLLEILVGILLLLNPVGFTEFIIIVVGIVLLLMGLLSIIKYFRTDIKDAMNSQLLSKGLIILLIGGFCTLKSEWFIATFPILTVVYGVAILLAGLGKIQWMMDAIRLKRGKWFLPAISALLSVVCGIVIIMNPFSSTVALWMFTGISLIVEAVFDGVTLFFVDRKSK